MLMINPFDTAGFTVTEMTDAINYVPNVWGLTQQMGLFDVQPIGTLSALIEMSKGSMNLLPSVPRGGPRTVANRETRNMRSFTVLHVPHEDAILPSDLQDIRAFASQDTERLDALMARKLARLRLKHAQTLEYMQMSTLKGVLKDGAGVTQYDWFAEFQQTQHTETWQLSSGTYIPDAGINSLKRYMELNLFGETMTGIMVLCSPEFFDALTMQAQMRAAYQYYQNAGPQLNREDVRSRFVHKGVVFQEYLASFTLSDGTTVEKAIPADEAIAFPLGTTETFRTHFAPGNFIDTANEQGQTLYARQMLADDWSKVRVISEQNPLPVCRRPELLVKMVKN